MSKKLFLGALAMAVALPVIVAPVQAAEAKESSFKDVSNLGEETKAKIDYLVTKGVIFGFPDNTFRPYTKVTRGQYASFIARAFDLPMPKNPKAFKDVTDKVSTYEGIVKAYEAGIIQGYPDGRFGPNEEITRAQMAIMMDKALQSKGSYPQKATLTYVDGGSIGKSSYEAVQRLTHYGIMGASSPEDYFAPQISGDRLLTVLSIYSLLEVTGLLDDAVIIDPKPEPPKPEVKPDPEPDPEPEVKPDPKPDSNVTVVKGFKFTYDNLNKFWRDEYRGVHKTILVVDETTRLKKGQRYVIDTNNSEHMSYMDAMFAILYKGVNLEKDQFLNAKNQVRETGKPVIVGNYKFEHYYSDKKNIYVSIYK